MSSNPDSKPRELKALVTAAAAKERRSLSISIVFTVIVLAIGFGWIAYSANRVVKLKQEESRLRTVNEQLNLETEKQKGLLLKINSDIKNVQPTLDRLSKGETTSKEENKIAAAALSSAQESVQFVLNNPTKLTTTATPTPTPTLTSVPDVTKIAAAEAEQKLRTARLSFTRVDQPGKGAPGMVLYQDPIAGQRVPVDTQVKLYVVPTSQVSRALPDLKGVTAEEGTRRLRELGLTVRIVDQQGFGPPGTVLYQDPFAGRRVPVGSQVSLYVIPKN
ncbi:MAG TPA: PASTA domain-containing protein [Pyrinomonadaceae bacterium]|nr:PASTA domain-containing protein [Pyrinomonadaceae bacterium]